LKQDERAEVTNWRDSNKDKKKGREFRKKGLKFQ
jgi:hypothetical protein